MGLAADSSKYPVVPSVSRAPAPDDGKVSSQRVRVLLVADTEIIVRGVSQILTASGDRVEVVGSAGWDENVSAGAVACRAEVVLVDADRHGGGVDLGLVARLVEEESNLRVVVLTQCREERCLFEALQAGVAGYLLKSLSGAELVHHLERARDGQVVIDPSMASTLALSLRRTTEVDGWPGAQLGLSRRESEVLVLVADGLSNREIAERLIVGQETVKTHLSSLYRKLEVRDRAGAVALALRYGILV